MAKRPAPPRRAVGPLEAPPPMGVDARLWRWLTAWAMPGGEWDAASVRMRLAGAEVARDQVEDNPAETIRDRDILPDGCAAGWLASWEPRLLGDTRRGFRHDLILLSAKGRVSHAVEWSPTLLSRNQALALTRRGFKIDGDRLPDWDEAPLFLPPMLKAYAGLLGRLAAQTLATRLGADVSEQRVDAYERLVAGFEYGRLRMAARPLLSRMDGPALRLCEAAGVKSVRAYDRIVLSKHRLRRIEAGQSFPLLAATVLQTRALVEAVDAGEPFTAALAAQLAVPERLLRHLAGASRRDVPLQNDEDAPQLLEMLRTLDPATLPTLGRDWRALLALWRAEGAYWRLVAHLGDTAPLLTQADGRWRELATRIHTEAGGKGALDRGPWLAFTDAFDVVRAAAKALVMPVWAAVLAARTRQPLAQASYILSSTPEAPLALAAEMVFGGLPPVAIAARARACRTRPGLLDAVGDQRSWEPLVEACEAPGSVAIVPLTCSAELRDEIRALRHSVGGFDGVCAQLGHHIVSLRSLDGRRLSTAELRCPQGAPLEVVQHRGLANAPAPESAQQALAWLSEEIVAERIPVDHRRLAAGLELRRRAEAESGRDKGGGLDVVAAGAVLWRPLLEKPWGELAPMGLIEAVARRVRAAER